MISSQRKSALCLIGSEAARLDLLRIKSSLREREEREGGRNGSEIKELREGSLPVFVQISLLVLAG